MLRVTLRDIQAGQAGLLPTLGRVVLHGMSWGWSAAQHLKRAAYAVGLRRVRRLDVPVVCVGNLTAGGTGKTPCVIWLARRLLAAGRKPGILARGYGPRAPGGGGLNDEGAVIRRALGEGVPQMQDGDRVRGGRALLAAHPEVDVVLLDDGFQHWGLARDLDLVLLDATCPFGFGHPLPRGLLRESPRALRRAGGVLLTRAERLPEEDLDGLRSRVGGLTDAPLAVVRSRPAPDGIEEELRGARVLACCGIGRPEAFLGTLADLGAEVVARRILKDHEALPEAAWPALVAEARAAGAECVVTTRKDAVKVQRLPADVTVVDVEMEIVEGEEAFWSAVCEAIGL